jgi:hypothetical protein
MGSLRKFISIFVVLCLLIETLPVFAQGSLGNPPSAVPIVQNQNLISGDEDKPQNPPGTPAGVECISENIIPSAGRPCCVGLGLNSAGKCDEIPVSSPDILSCSSNADCSMGRGCFSQTQAALTSGAHFIPTAKEASQDFIQEFRATLPESGSPKSAGQSCVHSRDCDSYSCLSGVCEDKKSCRYALLNEVASGVECQAGLVKDPSGKCVTNPNAANPVYTNTEDPQFEDGQKCMFTLPEEDRNNAIVAMRSLRSMEFFLSNISTREDEECFRIVPTLKPIGRKLSDSRKQVLENFTEVLNGIEFDFKQLVDATDKGPTAGQMITIHQGSLGAESLSNANLATRQTSGYDSLMMLYRRNTLFKNYEEAMKEIVEEAHAPVAKLSEAMSGWTDSSTSWNMGSHVVSSYNCEASKYQTRKWWKWKTHYYQATHERWAYYYEMSGSGGSSVIDKPYVTSTLNLLSADKNAATKFKAQNYYLIDPLIYWSKPLSAYGAAIGLKKKSGFLGFSGFRDLRKAWRVSSLGPMFEDSRAAIINHMKNLKVNSSQRGFIYEPELVTTQAKDCLNNPANPENCAPFEEFLNELQQEAFAYFLAYGYSPRDSYAGFFTDANTMRRALLRKLDSDMRYISTYYSKLITQRDKQNQCLDRLLKGIEDSGILTRDRLGLTEGGTYYLPGQYNGNSLNAQNNARLLKSEDLIKLRRQNFNFNLRNVSATTTANSRMDNLVTSSSSGAGTSRLSDSDRAFLAGRAASFKRANEKAAKAGIDVAGKVKVAQDLTNELARSSVASRSGKLGSSFGASGGDSRSRAGELGGMLSTSSLDKPNKEESNKSNESVASGNEADNKDGSVAGTSAGTSGLTSGLGQDSMGQQVGEQGNATNGATSSDGTGLSDEDKLVLMSAYEKNKSDYEGSEEDGLFSKVSKAYVRNLDKVLKKKKKIQD